jgi:sucrose-6-phosphate hydrolase SacC (GH32 family)
MKPRGQLLLLLPVRGVLVYSAFRVKCVIWGAKKSGAFSSELTPITHLTPKARIDENSSEGFCYCEGDVYYYYYYYYNDDNNKHTTLEAALL